MGRAYRPRRGILWSENARVLRWMILLTAVLASVVMVVTVMGVAL